MKKILLLLFVGFCLPVFADPLHIAVRSLDFELFKKVIATEPNVNAADSDGLTPLHYACRLGIVEMTTILLQNGADPKITSRDGKNALHHAVSISALCFSPQQSQDGLTVCPLTIPAMLASAGVDVNACDASGNTALHIAAQNGLVGVIAALIQSGADPDRLNSAGDAPLHLVGGMLPHICAQVLLVNGADASIKNAQGKDAIELALQKKNQLLVNMINKYAGNK